MYWKLGLFRTFEFGFIDCVQCFLVRQFVVHVWHHPCRSNAQIPNPCFRWLWIDVFIWFVGLWFFCHHFRHFSFSFWHFNQWSWFISFKTMEMARMSLFLVPLFIQIKCILLRKTMTKSKSQRKVMPITSINKWIVYKNNARTQSEYGKYFDISIYRLDSFVLFTVWQ